MFYCIHSNIQSDCITDYPRNVHIGIICSHQRKSRKVIITSKCYFCQYVLVLTCCCPSNIFVCKSYMLQALIKECKSQPIFPWTTEIIFLKQNHIVLVLFIWLLLIANEASDGLHAANHFVRSQRNDYNKFQAHDKQLK